MSTPSAADLIAVPEVSCGTSQNYCPLMRTCAVCGYRFVTAKGRRQHQNGCPGEVQIEIATAQHTHRTIHHRRR